jgi:uncharacterized protein YjbI with pentapeptide repeats
MPTIDDIEKDLLERADGASVEDLGKIAAAMKAVAETKQTEANARNKARETRLELFKSLAAFLVPVVSLLALFGTIISQNKQLEASRQQLEDTEWRDLLTSLKGQSDSVYSDPTVAPRLRSFFASPVYGEQAKSIAGRLMGHISNPDGFRDLYSAVFGDVTQQSVESIIDISRVLFATRQAQQGQCNDFLVGANIPFDPGLLDCGIYSDDEKANALIAQFKVPAQFASMRRSAIQLTRESSFLEGKLFSFLRANYHAPRDRARAPGLDLSSAEIVKADFSELDLTDFNIAGVIFDTVDFRDAIINPKGRIPVVAASTGSPDFLPEHPDFRGSTWWEARYVEPSLLVFLTNWFFPYVRSDTRYPVGYSITQAAYETKVRILCKAANVACPSTLRFGQAPTGK